MLCDGRMVCGCADPVRQARPRRRADGVGRRRSGPASAPPALRRDIERRRLEVLRRLPAEAAAREGRARRRSATRRRPAAVAPLHRVHRRLQHLVRPGLLRAGNRHHAHAAGRHARLRPVHAASSTKRGRRSAASTSSTTARRSSTSARIEMCEYIKARFPHIYLYTSTNGLALHRGAGRGGSCARGSTRSPSRSTARRPRATPSTGSAATSPRRSATCGAAADEKRRAGRDVPFINWRYILFTHNDSDEEMTLARDDGGARSASTACAGRSPIIRRTCSRAASCRAAPRLAAIEHEIWDDNNLGNAIPGATPRARIDVSGLAGRACRASPGAGRPVDRSARRVTQPARPARSRRRPPTAGGWSALGAQLCAARRLAHQPRLRARLAARNAAAGVERRRPDDGDGARQAGTLRVEVRPGERGDRLVRGLRLADHDEDACGDLERHSAVA